MNLFLSRCCNLMINTMIRSVFVNLLYFEYLKKECEVWERTFSDEIKLNERIPKVQRI